MPTNAARSLVTLAEQLMSSGEGSHPGDGDGSDFLAAAVSALVCADLATLAGIPRELPALRLEGARAELARDGGARRRVADVASRWGFEDPAAFARAFRGAYGTAPSDVRPGAGVWRHRTNQHEPT